MASSSWNAKKKKPRVMGSKKTKASSSWNAKKKKPRVMGAKKRKPLKECC